MRHWTVALVFVWLGCAHHGARSHTTRIPEAARDAIWEHSGGAEVHIERDGDDRYMATWTDKGLSREVVVDGRGEVLEEKREVRETEVPAQVRAGATKALGTGTLTYVLRGDGRYEARSAVGGNDLVLSVTGGVVKDDDDDIENTDEDIDNDANVGDDVDDGT